MSDAAPTDLIRFARSPAFRDKIRYISADSRCKNVWRLSTTVPSYFPQYKGFSCFLDTETIRVVSCILFHEDLSASIRHILGDIQVEQLWLLGRAIDAVQAIKCRITEWAATAPALLTLADHQHELVGLGDRRTQHFDHVMWYTKATLMLANDHLPANEQRDWNKPEYALSLYLYLKKEQGVCLCVHREGLSHASCCATLFKLYSLPIEAWRDANISLFSEADPSARPRSELRGLMGRLGACGYPMLPPTIDHVMHDASAHPQQIPNAPKAFRYGTMSDRLPSAPSGTTPVTSPTNARFAVTPSLPSKQPPNAPRALMFRCLPPASQSGRPLTPQHGQNTVPSSAGRPSVTSNDQRSSSTSTIPTIQHQLPPRPPTFEPPPRRYYGRSGVYVGRRLTYPLAEALGRPGSHSTSLREHAQHSCPPLNQYMMQLHPPRSGRSNEPPSGASEIIATFDHLQSGARRRDLTHPLLHLAHTPTPVNRSLSSSVVRRSVEPTTSVNNKTANYDGEQLKRVEKWMGGDGGAKVHSHSGSISPGVSASEMVAKSPESGEADMEVDDPDSHLGAILAVAEDLSRQSVSEVADLQPNQDGNGGTLKKVASTIGPWSAGAGSDSGGTQAKHVRLLGTGAENGGITPSTFDGGSAEAQSLEQTTAQVFPRSYDQKLDDRASDGEGAGEEEVRRQLPARLGSIPWWRSSKTGDLVCDEPLPGHREQRSIVEEPQFSSTTDRLAVDPDSGETGIGNGDQLKDRRNAETGNLQSATATVVTQCPASLTKTPDMSDLQGPGATAQLTPATTVKETAALGSSPAESLIRRSTRSSMGLLKKKSYAESSGDERACHSNSASGSKGAGGQAAKQKRNDTGGRAHPSTTGTKVSRSVPNTDKPLVTVAASTATPKPVKPMPDWEVQLRKMPNWEFELEMWKERELFRCRTTGHWDDRPFNIDAPQGTRWQAEVAKLRVNGNPIPTNELGYNLPWETGVAINLPPNNSSNLPQTSISVHQDIQSGNMSQRTLTSTSLFPSKPLIPASAAIQKKASAAMAKTAVRASSALSGRRTKVPKRPVLTPKGPTVDSKESRLGVRLGPSTPWSPSRPEAMNAISQSSPRPVRELPATRPQGTDGVIGLSDNEMENNRPNESPVKDRTYGTNCARPTAKRKRNDGSGQDVEGISPLRKARKVGVAAGSSPKAAEAAVHRAAGSTLCNAQPEVGDVLVLGSEDTRLISYFRHNHLLDRTPVAGTSIGVLSTPPPTPSNLNQISISSLERTKTPHAIAVAGPLTSNAISTLQGDQTLHATLPTAAAKKCLALRFFDSQLERRRDDGEAEKTRLLDAISWLTDLALDANKAEAGAEGVVFTGDYAENLVTKLDERIPITLWRKGLRLVIELADGTTTSLEPTVAAHADVTLRHLASSPLPTGKSKLSRFPKDRLIDPAAHWPVLAFCASNRCMIMDEPQQEAQRIIRLLNTFCDVQLEDNDWTLEEGFSRKAEDGSEIVVPRVTIVTAHAREKIFTAFSPKATKKLAKSNILIFTDDEPFLWKPDRTNFGTLRSIPPTFRTEPPFVSVSIPSVHPHPVFRPHCWVSSDEATTTPGLAFHTIGDYGNGTYQYCYEQLMPMNEADWKDMARPLRFEF